MRFLITNDDGILAHGIECLAEAAQPLGEVFATGGKKLRAARHADAVETSRTELDAAGPLAKELSRVYEDEHDGRALEDASLQRYTLSLREFLNGKVEVRKRLGQQKQPKTERYEKWSYKDWKLK